jgi:phosphohistidine phosphatase
MELYLIRHAIAFPRDSGRWADDSLRPLTPEGEERFRRAARGLGWLAPTVEIVLASPYPRAWRTAELLAEEAGWPAPVPCDELAADRTSADAARILLRRTAASQAAVAMVGHEPNLSELASLLLVKAPGRLVVELKKGGAMCLTFEGEAEPGGAALRWLLTPKVLRALRS